MCTVTKEEIEAAADKFIVKKDGNLLIVAGYDYQETLAAGDALVEWLQQNIHK
jgi:spermidine/putrescine-binding protein